MADHRLAIRRAASAPPRLSAARPSSTSAKRVVIRRLSQLEPALDAPASTSRSPATSAMSRPASTLSQFVPDDEDVAWVSEVTRDGRAFAERAACDRPRLLSLGIGPQPTARGPRVRHSSRPRQQSTPPRAKPRVHIELDGGEVVFRPRPPSSPGSVIFASAATPPPRREPYRFPSQSLLHTVTAVQGAMF